MDIEEIVIAKLADRVLSDAEEALFGDWYGHPENRLHYETLLREHAAAIAGMAGKVDHGSAWQKISPLPRPFPKKRRLFIRYAAAILILISAGATVYLTMSERTDNIAGVDTEAGPAVFKATLTYAGGDVVLSDDKTIEAVTENGRITYNNSSEGLKYNSEEMSNPDVVAYNTVAVPRGGYYKVELSDKTVVWMNSETSLRFPVAFKGDTRIVELKGEAYFSVARDNSKPFIVRTDDYDIRVTGTEFNVKSYRNGTTSTTLVEGAVQIEHEGTVKKLVPGQRAMLFNGQITLINIDTGDFTAWHDGAFSFTLDRLEDITDELSRWYDVEVIYSDPSLKDLRFSAWFSRDSELSEIIRILEKTQKIKLNADGEKLIVKR